MLDHDGDAVTGGGRAHDGRHVDEGTVHAWLDGQLSGDEEARISAHIEACAACAAIVGEARGHIAAATRILNALDGVPARVVPRATPRVSRWHLRAAAAIVVVALGTAVVVRGPGRSLRSMYEAAPVASTHVPQAAGAPHAPAAPSPNANAALRGAGPMVRPEAKQGNVAEKRLQESGSQENALQKKDLRQAAPPTEALAAKSRRESSVVAQASPPANAGGTANAPTVRPERAAPSALSAPAMAPTTENSIAGRARADVAPPSVNDALVRPPSTAAAAAAPMRVDSEVRRITGRVVEADEGKPIAAASVVVSGTRIGSHTTDSGSFTMAVPSDAKVLTARRIGYLAQTVPLTPGATDYTIPMRRDRLQLEAEVVTGVATSVSSQNAAGAAKVTATDSTGASSGKPGAVAGAAARCRGRVVRVSMPGGAGGDSLSVLLTGVPSINANYPGLVVRPVPDTSGAEFGRWQPIGADSALVTLNSIAGPMPRRVGCGG